MSTIFGFVVGYVVGARAGSEGWDRLEQAMRDIRDSDEFQNFLTLLRDHVRGTLRSLNERLEAGDTPLLDDVDRLTAEARRRLGLGKD